MSVPKIGRVAVVEMTSTTDKESNYKQSKNVIENICNNYNIDMIFFPEAFAYISDGITAPTIVNDTTEITKLKTENKDQLNQYLNLAKKHNVWISYGGYGMPDTQNPGFVRCLFCILHLRICEIRFKKNCECAKYKWRLKK